MFCHGCGSFCPESWQFCSGCGTKVPSTSSDQEASARVAPTCSATSAIGNPSFAAPAPTRSAVGSVSFAAVPMPQVSESKPLSFEQFLKERKTTSSRFQLTKKKGKVVKAEKVKVNVSLAHRRFGNFCKQRGTTLPVEVHERAGKDYLTFQAKAKHAAFNRKFIDPEKDYVLLYHDFEIVDKIPGTSQPFNLEIYKNMVGKKYNRIYFHLCTKDDYFDESSSSDEEQMPLLNTNLQIADEINHNEVFGDSSGEIVLKMPTDSCSVISDGLESQAGSQKTESYKTFCDIICIDDGGDSSLDEDPLLPAFGDNAPVDEIPIADKKEVLKNLIASLQLTGEEKHVIRIRRKCLWEDSLRFFKRNSEPIEKQLMVNFIGEQASDDGGPRREYLMLLINCIANETGLLEGSDGHKIFTLNPLLLQTNTYYEAGRMVAVSIQQGGPGLRCLSPYTFYAIANRPDLCKPTIEDIPDLEFREKVNKIRNAKKDSFDAIVAAEVDLLIECGITKLSWQFEENDLLVNSLCGYIVSRSMAAVQQFVAGLKSVRLVYECMLENLQVFSLLFTCGEPMEFTSSCLLNLCRFAFSPEGSNDRVPEEATAYWWEEMLSTFDEEKAGFTAGDLLLFITGAKTPPPAGFGKNITIEFYTQESNGRRMPFSSTCALVFHLPRGISSQEELQNLLFETVQLGVGYGQI